ncbi:2-C-methyl-D-erythritol 4-phosphate cytidylyltransferase [Sediminihabitans luteus]|uniref:2-C-methyl-D-erythritol 4-phosphate cytidylyltransferase n=1 Tax=Sediminihabitans luteus TaxID=1138585 RepID=A0A2M9CED3_9CELL|nr:2-C-methyl-D-erythritol 4-phosphate cytidylyltransferase [Sediminihabitans luteus]PJJ70210.1 2-C-methyl-D-erythritol 4-phosphate cytidylyltransferase [Sediminihabitans luteus]GII97681.1 2-C-methyl-D-erythritol 4-phosphate cytidylyltransferase [Sediminihabitans luteus]
MTTLAILTSAGSGVRLGAAVPKALVLLDGVPLVVRAARGLAASGVVDEIVVTAPADHAEHVRGLLDHLERDDAGTTVPVVVVPGGVTRQASVAAGLAAADPAHDVVLVHDAARPLTPPDLVRRVADAVRAGHGAVVPGVPVTDTVKQVRPAGEAASVPVQEVVGTVDRSVLRAVQTPQGFARDVLERAHAAGAATAHAEGAAATDDAGLVERDGGRVVVVEGDEHAMKITTPRDLRVAELLLTEDR